MISLTRNVRSRQRWLLPLGLACATASAWAQTAPVSATPATNPPTWAQYATPLSPASLGVNAALAAWSTNQ